MEGYPLPGLYEKILVKKEGEAGFYGKVIDIKTVYIVSDGTISHEVKPEEFVIGL